MLRRVSELVVLRQEPQGLHQLSDGARFRRIDPYCLGSTPAREALEELLHRLGVTTAALQLAQDIAPLVREIVGPVTFRRSYLYLYEEDDYISVHNDHQVGDRIDVQFPVSMGTFGGLRVLSDGLLRMHADTPGAMNILGPRIWHEVPPLLRMSSSEAPRRLNLGFRFVPEPNSPDQAIFSGP